MRPLCLQPYCLSIKGAAIFCSTSFVPRKKEEDGCAARCTREIESPAKKGAGGEKKSEMVKWWREKPKRSEGEARKRLTRKSHRKKAECIFGSVRILGRPRAAISTLIANHFSQRPRWLLPIHFGGGEAPSSDWSSGAFVLYPRVGENVEAARREVGENISLAHLLIPTCLPIQRLFQHLLFVAEIRWNPSTALMNRQIVHSPRAPSRKSIVFSKSRYAADRNPW